MREGCPVCECECECECEREREYERKPLRLCESVWGSVEERRACKHPRGAVSSGGGVGGAAACCNTRRYAASRLYAAGAQKASRVDAGWTQVRHEEMPRC